MKDAKEIKETKITDIRKIEGWKKYSKRQPGITAVQIKEKMIIETLDSYLLCYAGDYLVREEDGELYIFKPDVFEKRYWLKQ